MTEEWAWVKEAEVAEDILIDLEEIMNIEADQDTAIMIEAKDQKEKEKGHLEDFWEESQKVQIFPEGKNYKLSFMQVFSLSTYLLVWNVSSI